MPCHIDVRESPVASGACRLSRKKTWHGRRFGTSIMGTRRSYPCREDRAIILCFPLNGNVFGRIRT